MSFCSNDYLGLADTPLGRAGVAVGAGASRLVAGEHVEHEELEAALARWLDAEAALLFTSGYAANVGVVPALAASPDDLVLSDALNHASLVDGCRLARGETRVFPHLDVDAVEAQLKRRGAPSRQSGRAWVVTESYFSMDADSPDLGRLRRVCDELGAALIVDEAHAFGVLGPDGRGLLASLGIHADVTVGTLGKAFGAAGAFVVGCQDLIDWLWNRARSFVFSTGLSPALARAGKDALGRLTGPGDDGPRGDAFGGDAFGADTGPRVRVLERAAQLRDGLRDLGHPPMGYGHIVPWLIGDSATAVRFAETLQAQGFDVQAIRPPSVPPGTARIRFTASARQSAADVDRLVSAVRELRR